MKRKQILGLVVLGLVIVFIGIVLFGSVSNPNGLFAAQNSTLTFGVALPLSGEFANYGQDARNAIELAVRDSKKDVQIIYEDTQGDPASAVVSVSKLITVDKLNVIIGPFISSEALAAVPFTKDGKVLLINGSSTNPNLSNYDYFFRTIPSDALQGKFAAEYIYQKLGVREVVVAFDTEAYAIGVKTVFVLRFAELGGKIVFEQSFGQDDSDLRTMLAKIKDAPAGMVFLAALPTSGSRFLKQAHEIGMSKQVLGTESLESEKVLTDAGGAEGLLVTRAKTISTDLFNTKYKEAFGIDALSYAAYYYDAAMLVINAEEKCGNDATCVREYLLNMPVYDGVSGAIKFDTHGDVIDKEFTVIKVVGGKFVPIDKN